MSSLISDDSIKSTNPYLQQIKSELSVREDNQCLDGFGYYLYVWIYRIIIYMLSLFRWYTCSPCRNLLVYMLPLYESLGIQVPLVWISWYTYSLVWIPWYTYSPVWIPRYTHSPVWMPWYTHSPCMNPLVDMLPLYESLGIHAPLYESLGIHIPLYECLGIRTPLVWIPW